MLNKSKSGKNNLKFDFVYLNHWLIINIIKKSQLYYK